MSNDHTVPKMYLRRFAWQRKRGSRDWFISARRIDDLEQAFSANIRKVAAVTDFYGERVEKQLCKIEGDAVPAFDAMLDDPQGALPGPGRWPLGEDERLSLAWWIAGQIVRTTRQRRRLLHLVGQGADQLALPNSIRSLAGRDEHVRFMGEQLARLSWVIFDRPWGLGFSDVCLWTSDVPVVIVNGQDDENQLLATAFWDVILPLDPHRFLILPGRRAQENDPRKRVDHLAKLDGGLGTVLSSMLFEAADKQVFWHSAHDPLPHLHLDGPRLPTPWTGNSNEGPSWVLDYETLTRGFTVERRWLSEHAPPRYPPAEAS
jgi:hypothetical protein